jgi:RNA polymerase sporulation-specific sigma factor
MKEVLLIKNGEYENFQIITNRYLPLIVKTAKQYFPQSEIEDVVQESLFALYSAVKNYDSEKASFATFANVCIKRSVISHLRKSNAKKVIPAELISDVNEADLPLFESPESLLIEKENFDTLQNNIKLELSDMEYNILQHFLTGKSYSDIAKILNVTEKSVDNALSRIRKKLKK